VSSWVRIPRPPHTVTRTEIRTSKHVAVDARGLLLAMLITAASVQDRGAAKPLLWNLRKAFPSVSWRKPTAEVGSSSGGPSPGCA
jgi:hypothetical protein